MAEKVGEVILKIKFSETYCHYEVYYLKDAQKGDDNWKGDNSYWVVYIHKKDNEEKIRQLLTLGEMRKEVLGILKDDKYKHFSVVKNDLPSKVWGIAQKENMMLNL